MSPQVYITLYEEWVGFRIADPMTHSAGMDGMKLYSIVLYYIILRWDQAFFESGDVLVHFSMCPCHPSAGAMLISLYRPKIYRIIPE